MKKLKFSKDNGSEFYKELIDQLDDYFKNNQIERTGNSKMYFKMSLYFFLSGLFYFMMITASSIVT